MHSLAEIMEKLDKLGLVYEPEDSVFHLKQYDDINEFKEFDNGLMEKEKRASLVRQLFISLLLFIYILVFCIMIFDKFHNRQKFEM